VVLIGIVGLTGTMSLQYVAFATAPIVAANVLAYAWPLLLAAVWLAATIRSRHTLVSAGLALFGFLGIALIFAGPNQSTDDPIAGTGLPWGYLAALGSAACMAIYTLGVSRRPAAAATTLLIPATLAGTVAALVFLVLRGGTAPTGTGVLVAAYLGLGPMAAGYALWTRAMTGGGAERLSPLGYATPLLSTVLLLATGAPAAGATFLGIGLVLSCGLACWPTTGTPTCGLRDSTRSGTAAERLAACIAGAHTGGILDRMLDVMRITSTGRPDFRTLCA